MMIILFATLCFGLGMVAAWAINLYSRPMAEDLLERLHHIEKRLAHMANELSNLQAAATSIITKLTAVEAALAAVPPPGVDPAAVQAVANQLETAAGVPNTTAG